MLRALLRHKVERDTFIVSVCFRLGVEGSRGKGTCIVVEGGEGGERIALRSTDGEHGSEKLRVGNDADGAPAAGLRNPSSSPAEGGQAPAGLRNPSSSPAEERQGQGAGGHEQWERLSGATLRLTRGSAV